MMPVPTDRSQSACHNRRSHFTAALPAAMALAVLAGVMPMAPAMAVTIPEVITFDAPDGAAVPEMIDVFDNARTENGLMVIDNPETGSWTNNTFAFNGDGKRAVSLDVAIEFAPGAEGNARTGAGLVIRRSDDGGTGLWYYAISNAEGYIQIGSYIEGFTGTSMSVPLPDGRPAGAPVRISAIEEGDGISVYVDDERVTTLSDSAIEGRDIGVISLGGGLIHIDNVVMNTKGDRTPPGLPPLSPDMKPGGTPTPTARPEATPETEVAGGAFDFDDSDSIFGTPDDADEGPEETDTEDGSDQTDAEMIAEGAEGFARIVALERACPVLNAAWAKQLTEIAATPAEASDPLTARRLALMRSPAFEEAFQAALADAPEALPWAACLDLVAATSGAVVDAPR